MSESWEDIAGAMKEAEASAGNFAEPDRLPPGRHWVRIARTNSYKRDGEKTVVLNFVELDAENPREHPHFEKFVKNPRRMAFVLQTLKALGAPEELRTDPEPAFEWLCVAHQKCAGFKYQIEISATESGDRTFYNAKILKEERITPNQPEEKGASWENWGDKKDGDDDVSF